MELYIFDYQVTEIGITKIGDMIITSARFVTTSQVECSLTVEQTGGSYIISISNNGVAFNQTVIVISYMPDCYTCDLEALTCAPRVSVCFLSSP